MIMNMKKPYRANIQNCPVAFNIKNKDIPLSPDIYP